MRLLVLTSSYPTPAHVAASAFLQDWASAQVSLGHHVTVSAPEDAVTPPMAAPRQLPRVARFAYAPLRRWQTLAYGAGMYDNVRRNPLRLMQLPSFLRGQHAQARALAEEADIVHAHWLFPAGLVAWRLSRRCGIPFVVSVHSTDLHLLASMPGGRHLARAITAAASHVHFVADHHRRRFVDWLGRPPDSWHVAPMGVADRFFSEPALPLASTPRLGYLGRLITFKGVDRLLRACAALGVRHLRIAGDGPERRALERLAARLDVSVDFTGPVTGHEKVRFLDSCDVLVFPSRHGRGGRGEGVPVSLMEALARGRIAVASDSGGTGEIVRDGQSGFLFPAADDAALRATLLGVIRNWPLIAPVAVRARQSVRRFTASAVARQHGAIYTGILAGPLRLRKRA